MHPNWISPGMSTCRFRPDLWPRFWNPSLGPEGVSFEIKDRQIVLLPKDLADSGTERTVRGSVTDAQGYPVPGAAVSLKNEVKAITDLDGKYSFSLPVGKVELTFSSMGYETITVLLDTRQENLDIALPESVTSLEASVAIGYGTVKKKDLMGATSYLGGAILPPIPTYRSVAPFRARCPGSV